MIADTIEVLSEYKKSIKQIVGLNDRQSTQIINGFYKDYSRLYGDFGARSREYVVKINDGIMKQKYEINEKQFLAAPSIYLKADLPVGSLAAEENIAVSIIPEEYKYLMELESRD